MVPQTYAHICESKRLASAAFEYPHKVMAAPRHYPRQGRARKLGGGAVWTGWVTALVLLTLGLAALAQPLDLQLRSLKETKPGSDQWQVIEVRTNWAPGATAVVSAICGISTGAKGQPRASRKWHPT